MANLSFHFVNMLSRETFRRTACAKGGPAPGPGRSSDTCLLGPCDVILGSGFAEGGSSCGERGTGRQARCLGDTPLLPLDGGRANCSPRGRAAVTPKCLPPGPVQRVCPPCAPRDLQAARDSALGLRTWGGAGGTAEHVGGWPALCNYGRLFPDSPGVHGSPRLHKPGSVKPQRGLPHRGSDGGFRVTTEVALCTPVLTALVAAQGGKRATSQALVSFPRFLVTMEERFLASLGVAPNCVRAESCFSPVADPG